jgi:hypothetical protein
VFVPKLVGELQITTDGGMVPRMTTIYAAFAGLNEKPTENGIDTEIEVRQLK